MQIPTYLKKKKYKDFIKKIIEIIAIKKREY